MRHMTFDSNNFRLEPYYSNNSKPKPYVKQNKVDKKLYEELRIDYHIALAKQHADSLLKIEAKIKELGLTGEYKKAAEKVQEDLSKEYIKEVIEYKKDTYVKDSRLEKFVDRGKN